MYHQQGPKGNTQTTSQPLNQSPSIVSIPIHIPRHEEVTLDTHAATKLADDVTSTSDNFVLINVLPIDNYEVFVSARL